MANTSKFDPMTREYWREVEASPLYSSQEMRRQPMIKVAAPVEETLMKKSNLLAPTLALYNSPLKLNYEAPSPLQLLADHVKPGGLLAPNLEELLKLPPLGLEQRLTLELTKIPTDSMASYKMASTGEPMLGHNPNSAVMSYLDMPKPYVHS